jgi:hypothetical protein
MARSKVSLSDFQHRSAGNGKPSGRRFDLGRIDPQAKPFSTGSKARDKARTAELALEVDRLQDLFYADRRFKLLVVLQGTDTSGKDGTIRGVFGQTSALGVHAVPVPGRRPPRDERAHDYLWRIHQRVPAEGEIVIFNRSHYEDVLVPVVNGWMTDLSAEYKALANYRPTHKVRFVTAASLFDGHDAAINIMRRILQGMGAEVIHLGHNRSVDEVVTAALQEDVQGIAISSYQGGHVEYFKYMVDLLKPARRRAHSGVRRRRRRDRAGRDPRPAPTAWRASSARRTASAWAWPA